MEYQKTQNFLMITIFFKLVQKIFPTKVISKNIGKNWKIRKKSNSLSFCLKLFFDTPYWFCMYQKFWRCISKSLTVQRCQPETKKKKKLCIPKWLDNNINKVLSLCSTLFWLSVYRLLLNFRHFPLLTKFEKTKYDFGPLSMLEEWSFHQKTANPLFFANLSL